MPVSLVAAFVLGSSPVAVNPSVSYQKWDGWGTSLCWWSHVVGTYPEPVREDIMQKFFGFLKMNIARYNIPGGENPAHHHMEYRAQLPGYLSPKGEWDWDADKGQRWCLQRAKELGANRFESFSNSPPYWMTESQCAAGGKDGKDNLPAANVDAFVKYLVDVNEHFRKELGIEFETLDPLNEPHANWWPSGGRQEGCRVTMGPAQSAIIEALGRTLKAAKSKTKISASDENTSDIAVRSWDALSPAAKDLVWRINVHHYGGSKQLEMAQRAEAAKKRLWMSEEGDNDPSGLTMASRIVKDIRDMKASAWIYWQVIDTKGSNWGLLDMDLNHRGEQYVVHKKYFVFGNFSRFIRPGATILDIADDRSIAAKIGRDLVIVSVNKGASRAIEFDLSGFKSVGAKAEVYRTSGSDDLKKLDSVSAKDKRVTAELAPDSVTTFVVRAS